MDEFFARYAGGSSPEPSPTEHVDPFLARRLETRAWELRSAQWRAWALAEHAFGPDVEVSLVGRPGYPQFRGILHITVPFLELDDHRSRESLFLHWAWEDPVLRRVPLVFVFEPNPVEAP